MKIVVLDGYTLNPGDLSWEDLQELGDLTVHDRVNKDDKTIIEAIGSAEVILTNKTPISAKIIKEAPNLKYIGVLATGYNVVNVKEASKRSIVVTNVPSYGTQAVAQFTFGLILELCHHIGTHNIAVKSGSWTQCSDFCFWKTPLIELEGKTLGLIGFGNIGRATAKIASAFGMQVIIHTRTPQNNTNYKFVSLETLLKQSDIVSLHCPLTPQTHEIISKPQLQLMKSSAFLINTSRGPLVNEKDLQEALENQIIAGAAVDVVSEEPIKNSNPLLKANKCIVTPHIAWASKEARQRLLNTVVNNLKNYQEGSPSNVIKDS